MMAKKILNYIFEKRPPTMIALMEWCIGNGCWSEFRRCPSAWASCIREVNQELEAAKREAFRTRAAYGREVNLCLRYEDYLRSIGVNPAALR